MNVHLTRRQVLQSGLALGSALALPQARACEFTTTTLRVTHPWTRATAQDAGYAVVNMKIDQVMHADRLIGVETPVAGAAEIVGDPAGSKGLSLLIQQGQELQIGEAGIGALGALPGNRRENVSLRTRADGRSEDLPPTKRARRRVTSTSTG